MNIDPKGLRGFRRDRRRSKEPDATEGREAEHAAAERDAARSIAMARRVTYTASTASGQTHSRGEGESNDTI